MEQVLEFAGNHPFLTGGFVLVLVILVYTEVTRLARKFSEIDSRQAIRLMNADDAVVIDVSGSADYAKGHILGAINLPPSKIEAGNQQLVKYKDKPVLLYCKNGQVSPQMAAKLVGMGFSSVAVLKGGLAQWRADQQPVTKASAKKPAGKKSA